MTRTTIFILLALFSVQSVYSQEQIQWPKDKNGHKVVSEKFEIYEHLLGKYLNISEDIIKEDNSNIIIEKAEGEIQVGESGSPEFELHAIVNPNDTSNIVVGCMRFVNTFAEADLSISIYVTNDFGDTWQKSDFNGQLPNRIALGGGDPVFAYDRNGNLHMTWLLISANNLVTEALWGVYSAMSSDNGLTWGNRTVIEEYAFSDLLAFSDLETAPDKEWLAYDLNPSSPHFGNIYTSYVEINFDNQIPTYNITTKVMADGEAEFSNKLQLSGSEFPLTQFTSMETNSSGDVFVSFLADDNMETDKYAIYLAKSVDGGLTYEPNQKITDFYFPEIQGGGTTVSGVNPARLYPCPHIAVDKSGGPTDGFMYLAFTSFGIDGIESEGLDIYLCRSEDGGETWTTPQKINDDLDPRIHQFYSAIEVTNKGEVALAWYDRRDDVVNNQTDYYVGISNDNGESFRQFPVNTQSTDFNRIGSRNGNVGVGEYNEIVVVGDYIIPFWADGRTNDGNLAIYANFINLNNPLSTNDKLSLVNPDISIEGPYPNPVKDKLNFEMNLNKALEVRIQILDLSGRLISDTPSTKFNKGLHFKDIDVSNYTAGEYLLNIITGQGNIQRKFIVLRN